MNPFCPLCETDLDPVSGACPACRWQHATVATAPAARAAPVRRPTSLTERYRGTEWDTSMHTSGTATVRSPSGIPKARLLLVVGLFAVGGIYGAIMTMMGMVP
jgi:hypothetical protein